MSNITTGEIFGIIGGLLVFIHLFNFYVKTKRKESKDKKYAESSLYQSQRESYRKAAISVFDEHGKERCERCNSNSGEIHYTPDKYISGFERNPYPEIDGFPVVFSKVLPIKLYLYSVLCNSCGNIETCAIDALTQKNFKIEQDCIPIGADEFNMNKLPGVKI